ncbi:hypothetical protein HYH02_006680 [Chlamydomonas schloesseri]|uniref:Uncharacterized protein n=1 Tax=Chlamydomonas schloesseri TaxID=2026947 RepID=A0A835T6W0_9CHLO|nr:hypothetical protein HYH02_006680 [Chlamydomonas schloesseri]|eukprot:KAG2432696.1 hypothetical protein HYH02_006680 [Chlamydomonas schloesseri]
MGQCLCVTSGAARLRPLPARASRAAGVTVLSSLPAATAAAAAGTVTSTRNGATDRRPDEPPPYQQPLRPNRSASPSPAVLAYPWGLDALPPELLSAVNSGTAYGGASSGRGGVFDRLSGGDLARCRAVHSSWRRWLDSVSEEEDETEQEAIAAPAAAVADAGAAVAVAAAAAAAAAAPGRRGGAQGGGGEGRQLLWRRAAEVEGLLVSGVGDVLERLHRDLRRDWQPQPQPQQQQQQQQPAAAHPGAQPQPAQGGGGGGRGGADSDTEEDGDLMESAGGAFERIALLRPVWQAATPGRDAPGYQLFRHRLALQAASQVCGLGVAEFVPPMLADVAALCVVVPPPMMAEESNCSCSRSSRESTGGDGGGGGGSVEAAAEAGGGDTSDDANGAAGAGNADGGGGGGVTVGGRRGAAGRQQLSRRVSRLRRPAAAAALQPMTCLEVVVGRLAQVLGSGRVALQQVEGREAAAVQNTGDEEGAADPDGGQQHGQLWHVHGLGAAGEGGGGGAEDGGDDDNNGDGDDDGGHTAARMASLCHSLDGYRCGAAGSRQLAAAEARRLEAGLDAARRLDELRTALTELDLKCAAARGAGGGSGGSAASGGGGGTAAALRAAGSLRRAMDQGVRPALRAAFEAVGDFDLAVQEELVAVMALAERLMACSRAEC